MGAMSARPAVICARAIAFALAGLAAFACAARERPPEWAVPVEKPGLPNLHRVTGWLYRGAQPTEDGIPELKKLGIRTVIDLRAYHDDEPLLRGSEIALIRIPMHASNPKTEQVIDFLKVVADPARRPIFVHCQHGADRTGLMMALYRVAALGWTKEQAIEEMRDGGFGFHSVWRNLIDFILRTDIELVKKSAKL